MNQPLIEQLLTELYQADPDLRTKEDILRPLIAELLAGKPQIALDPQVRAQIKDVLLQRAASLEHRPARSWVMLTRPYWGLAGAALVALLVIPILTQPKARLAFAPDVNTTAERAFGSLNGTTDAGGMGLSAGRGGGGSAPATDASAEKVRPQSGGGSGYAAPYMEYVQPRFVYDGDIILDGVVVQVLRRMRGNLSQGALSGLVGSFDLGPMLNLRSFTGIGLASVNLLQDTDYGYGVYIDFVEGTVSVAQNWQRWPNPFAGCTEQDCYERLRIREDQIPSDAEAFEIAGAFLYGHGIALDGYGSPEVNKEWAIAYERAAPADRMAWYFPEQVIVTYPLIVEGLPVYEEGGAKAGMQVAVDVRTRRVSSVTNLTTRQYESSAYESISDGDVFRAALARGTWRDYGTDATGRSVEVSLRKPTRAWMRTWIPSTDGIGSEILVPAIVFEIIDAPKESYVWQQNIVLPLAAELYKPQPDGRPMPLDAGTSAPAAAEPGI